MLPANPFSLLLLCIRVLSELAGLSSSQFIIIFFHFSTLTLFFFFFFIFIYLFSLYNIVLILPYIDMNPPWVLWAGALGWPRGMGWGGRWEEGSGWGTPMADSSSQFKMVDFFPSILLFIIFPHLYFFLIIMFIMFTCILILWKISLLLCKIKTIFFLATLEALKIQLYKNTIK